MNHPLLSVVLPTRDRHQQLARAVESVHLQTYRPLELVVVDDGSTTPVERSEAGGHTRDVRIVVHRRETPGGPPAARNDGLQKAQGDFVLFLDDDDTLEPTATEQIMAWLIRHPDATACSSWHRVIRPDGSSVVFRGPTSVSTEVLRWCNAVGIVFGVVRRSTAGNALSFDPTLEAAEDWDLWLRLSELGPPNVLPSPLYCYRQHIEARVSRGDGVGAAGRASFLAKHRASMDGNCAAYHRACIALLEGCGRLDSLAPLLEGPYPLAAAMLASNYAAVRIGLRTEDPGLSVRALNRLIQRVGYRRSRINAASGLQHRATRSESSFD